MALPFFAALPIRIQVFEKKFRFLLLAENWKAQKVAIYESFLEKMLAIWEVS